jgi:two-component system sensor histidine kinase KdpD
MPRHLPRPTAAALRRSALGALVALGGVALCTVVMLQARAHLAVATGALVLVVPVVLGVVVGGFGAGVAAVAGGFLAYDYYFIPPYSTLTVGAMQNWVALGVYVVVMLTVARVVDRLRVVRGRFAEQAAATRRLFELTDLLIADKALPELLESIVSTVRAAFSLAAVALLLPESGEPNQADARLVPAAAAGAPLSASELAAATPIGGEPVHLAQRVPGGRARTGAAPAEDALVTIPLVATGRPVGALVTRGWPLGASERALLRIYANQAALAVERARLREQALRSELLEEADRWRSALIGAVSHDLRTPLATVKAAVSDLRRSDLPLTPADRDELLALAEAQSDHLARLVTNLLDMTRIHSGALVPRREEVTVDELIDEALAALAGTEVTVRVVRRLADELPPVLADHALIAQALANLVENAGLHVPDGGPIEIAARVAGERVVLSVSDDGPGVAPADRERIFLLFNRVSGAGRAGLGLAIVRAFVEAHGAQVRVGDSALGGAAFTFALPIAPHRTLHDADMLASEEDDFLGSSRWGRR